MRYIITTFLAATVLLTLTGCSRKSTAPRAASGAVAPGPDYYPLTVGSSWEYRVYDGHSAGRLDPTQLIQKRQIWIERNYDMPTGEPAMMVISRSQIPYPVLETSYVGISGGYVVRWRRRSSPVADTILAVPPAQGKTWHNIVSSTASVPVSFTAQEPVKTAAGSYPKAWRADEELRAGLPRSSTWFAPGVGMVMNQLVLERPDGTVTSTYVELTRADIK